MAESLADVDEAIDFLHFYARQIMVYQKQNPSAHSRGVLAQLRHGIFLLLFHVEWFLPRL